MLIARASLLVALSLLPAVPAVAEEAAADPQVLCTDGKARYVALSPNRQVTWQLAYSSDGKRFFQLPAAPGGYLTGDWFLEPRRYNPGNNGNFRGYDLRVYSRVELEKDKEKCAVVCGSKRTELTIVAVDKAKGILAAARFEPGPRKVAPYGLCRDNTGIYYYVDRGIAEKDRGRFRLFVGQKGNMKPQKMTNVVSDSEGDIFATKTGSLRLVLDKRESVWIQNEKQTPLKVVPVDENLGMIYNDLGIYAGERLGTPCDDF